MKTEFSKRIVSSIILLPIVIYCIMKGSVLFNFLLIVSFLIVLYEWHNLEKRNLFKIIGIFFIIFSFFSFYKIRNISESSLDDIILLLTICISTDIGGYVFGKILKGPKLTKISPNKTISGVLGSYIFSIIVVLIIFHFNFIDVQLENFSLVNFLYILVISTISQIGDIIISYFKRLSNVKNTGNVLPGHGGLLDRIDGMIFVFPISYLIINSNIYHYFQWKKIAILGSTGSIGKTLIKILLKDKENFEIKLLSANKNYKELFKQAKIFNVKNLIITDKKNYLIARKINKKNINIFNNYKCFNEIFKKKIDYVMNAIVGLDGLYPTYQIIKHTKKLL